MEKRLRVKVILIFLSSLLMFFHWFDPVVKENEKGERAYKNKKYEEALKHFRIARNILSSSDEHRNIVENIVDELRAVANYIKSIKAETLKFSELSEEYKRDIFKRLKRLLENLSEFGKSLVKFSGKNEYIKDSANRIKVKLNILTDSIKLILTEKGGSEEIGKIYRDIVYIKSQIEQYYSKIDKKNKNSSPNLDALRYNIASTYYELGDYEAAKSEFKKINPVKSKINRSDILYDLANTHFKLKDYKTALELYKKSLLYNSEDMQARKNYEITLEMLKKQKQQKKKNKKDKNKKKNDKKKEDKKNNKNEKNKDKNKKKEDQDKNKKQKEKDKKKENKKKDEKKEKSKQDKQKQNKKEQEKKQNKNMKKPEEKHRNMLRFLNQNEKKLMKKMLKKTKRLRYGIKKTEKKEKDW